MNISPGKSKTMPIIPPIMVNILPHANNTLIMVNILPHARSMPSEIVLKWSGLRGVVGKLLTTRLFFRKPLNHTSAYIK